MPNHELPISFQPRQAEKHDVIQNDDKSAASRLIEKSEFAEGYQKLLSRLKTSPKIVESIVEAIPLSEEEAKKQAYAVESALATLESRYEPDAWQSQPGQDQWPSNLAGYRDALRQVTEFLTVAESTESSSVSYPYVVADLSARLETLPTYLHKHGLEDDFVAILQSNSQAKASEIEIVQDILAQLESAPQVVPNQEELPETKPVPQEQHPSLREILEGLMRQMSEAASRISAFDLKITGSFDLSKLVGAMSGRMSSPPWLSPSAGMERRAGFGEGGESKEGFGKLETKDGRLRNSLFIDSLWKVDKEGIYRRLDSEYFPVTLINENGGNLERKQHISRITLPLAPCKQPTNFSLPVPLGYEVISVSGEVPLEASKQGTYRVNLKPPFPTEISYEIQQICNENYNLNLSIDGEELISESHTVNVERKGTVVADRLINEAADDQERIRLVIDGFKANNPIYSTERQVGDILKAAGPRWHQAVEALNLGHCDTYSAYLANRLCQNGIAAIVTSGYVTNFDSFLMVGHSQVYVPEHAIQIEATACCEPDQITRCRAVTAGEFSKLLQEMPNLSDEDLFIRLRQFGERVRSDTYNDQTARYQPARKTESEIIPPIVQANVWLQNTNKIISHGAKLEKLIDCLREYGEVCWLDLADATQKQSHWLVEAADLFHWELNKEISTRISAEYSPEVQKEFVRLWKTTVNASNSRWHDYEGLFSLTPNDCFEKMESNEVTEALWHYRRSVANKEESANKDDLQKFEAILPLTFKHLSEDESNYALPKQLLSKLAVSSGIEEESLSRNIATLFRKVTKGNHKLAELIYCNSKGWLPSVEERKEIIQKLANCRTLPEFIDETGNPTQLLMKALEKPLMASLKGDKLAKVEVMLEELADLNVDLPLLVKNMLPQISGLLAKWSSVRGSMRTNSPSQSGIVSERVRLLPVSTLLLRATDDHIPLDLKAVQAVLMISRTVSTEAGDQLRKSLGPNNPEERLLSRFKIRQLEESGDEVTLDDKPGLYESNFFGTSEGRSVHVPFTPTETMKQKVQESINRPIGQILLTEAAGKEVGINQLAWEGVEQLAKRQVDGWGMEKLGGDQVYEKWLRVEQAEGLTAAEHYLLGTALLPLLSTNLYSSREEQRTRFYGLASELAQVYVAEENPEADLNFKEILASHFGDTPETREAVRSLSRLDTKQVIRQVMLVAERLGTMGEYYKSRVPIFGGGLLEYATPLQTSIPHLEFLNFGKAATGQARVWGALFNEVMVSGPGYRSFADQTKEHVSRTITEIRREVVSVAGDRAKRVVFGRHLSSLLSYPSRLPLVEGSADEFHEVRERRIGEIGGRPNISASARTGTEHLNVYRPEQSKPIQCVVDLEWLAEGTNPCEDGKYEEAEISVRLRSFLGLMLSASRMKAPFQVVIEFRGSHILGLDSADMARLLEDEPEMGSNDARLLSALWGLCTAQKKLEVKEVAVQADYPVTSPISPRELGELLRAFPQKGYIAMLCSSRNRQAAEEVMKIAQKRGYLVDYPRIK